MPDTQIRTTGVPVPSTTLVQTDQTTIIGDGSHERPLIAIGGGGGGITVEDEGAPIAGNPHTTMNFVGAGVAATDVAGVATVTIPGGVSGIVVEDEGTPIANNPHATVNFVGAGVAATDVAGVATVTVPGGPALSNANPATISDATDTPGTATDASRSDHLHAHGNRGGGTLHSLFTSLGAGFVQLNVVTPSPARALNAVFQPSATRPTLGIYSIDITCTLAGGSGAAGAIQLLSDSVNPPTTIRCEFFLDTGGNIGAGEQVTNIVEGLLVYLVPQGDFVSLTTVPSAGGPSFEFDFATEINL